MRMISLAALGALALATAPAGAAERPAPASADILAKVQSGAVASDYAQYRRYGYGPRRGYYGPRYGYGYGYPRYYRRNNGAAIGAGIAGLAAGALIGGAIASQQAQAAPAYGYQDPNVSYCIQRYRSYDPASGTYLGNDGLRHPCP